MLSGTFTPTHEGSADRSLVLLPLAMPLSIGCLMLSV